MKIYKRSTVTELNPQLLLAKTVDKNYIVFNLIFKILKVTIYGKK